MSRKASGHPAKTRQLSYNWHGLLARADEQHVLAMCEKSGGEAVLVDNDQLVVVRGIPGKVLRSVRDFIDEHVGPCGECKPGAPCFTVESGEAAKMRQFRGHRPPNP
jgi:hypothetical protein